MGKHLSMTKDNACPPLPLDLPLLSHSEAPGWTDARSYWQIPTGPRGFLLSSSLAARCKVKIILAEDLRPAQDPTSACALQA